MDRHREGVPNRPTGFPWGWQGWGSPLMPSTPSLGRRLKMAMTAQLPQLWQLPGRWQLLPPTSATPLPRQRPPVSTVQSTTPDPASTSPRPARRAVEGEWEHLPPRHLTARIRMVTVVFPKNSTPEAGRPQVAPLAVDRWPEQLAPTAQLRLATARQHRLAPTAWGVRLQSGPQFAPPR